MRLVLWLMLCAPVCARPLLHLELYSYEGVDYTCHIRRGHVWYEWQSRTVAKRQLSQAELRRLQQLLEQHRFDTLPGEMRERFVDSFDSLTVWDGRQHKRVTATTRYSGPKQAEFKRFRALLAGIRKIAPIPRFSRPAN